MESRFIIIIFLVVLSMEKGFGQKHRSDLMDTFKNSPKEVIWLPQKWKYNEQKGWKYVLLYKNGLPKSQKNYLKGKMTFSANFKYDKKDRLVMDSGVSFTTDTPTVEIYLTTYVEDSLGKTVREELRHKQNLVWIKDNIMYSDKNAPLAYSKKYFKSNSFQLSGVSNFLYDYDDDLKVVREKQINGDGDYVREITYEYNDNGDVRFKRTHVDMRTALNDQRQRSTSLVIYEYIYDIYGNWIKRFTSVNGSEIQLEMVRKIIY